MRKTTIVVALALAAAQLGVGQSTQTRKPSAAVHSTTDRSPKPSTSKPQPNGPIYADEVTTPPVQAATPKAPPTPAPEFAVKETPADLPSGTAIRMKLQNTVSSSTSAEGDPFNGRVTEAVVVNGRTVIPVGSSITGRLLRVSDPRRFAGSGSLRMMPESVMLPNGKSFAINAAMVDTSTPGTLTVDEEGRIKSKGITSGDKVEMVAGTGVGAVIGTIAGGGKGLLVGSMIGGGATVVHWLTKRHPVEVPAGTELIMEINRPMTVSATPLSAGE